MCAVPGSATAAAGANQMSPERQASFDAMRASGGDVGSWMRGELAAQGGGKLVDIKEYQAPASSGSGRNSTASERSPIASGARRQTVLGGSGSAGPGAAAATILSGATAGAAGTKQLLGQ